MLAYKLIFRENNNCVYICVFNELWVVCMCTLSQRFDWFKYDILNGCVRTIIDFFKKSSTTVWYHWLLVDMRSNVVCSQYTSHKLIAMCPEMHYIPIVFKTNKISKAIRLLSSCSISMFNVKPVHSHTLPSLFTCR